MKAKLKLLTSALVSTGLLIYFIYKYVQRRKANIRNMLIQSRRQKILSSSIKQAARFPAVSAKISSAVLGKSIQQLQSALQSGSITISQIILAHVQQFSSQRSKCENVQEKFNSAIQSANKQDQQSTLSNGRLSGIPFLINDLETSNFLANIVEEQGGICIAEGVTHDTNNEVDARNPMEADANLLSNYCVPVSIFFDHGENQMPKDSAQSLCYFRVSSLRLPKSRKAAQSPIHPMFRSYGVLTAHISNLVICAEALLENSKFPWRQDAFDNVQNLRIGYINSEQEESWQVVEEMMEKLKNTHIGVAFTPPVMTDVSKWVDIVVHGDKNPAKQFIAAYQNLMLFRKKFLHMIRSENIDAIICPCHESQEIAQIRLFAALDFPVAQVLGVYVVSLPFHEEVALRIAQDLISIE